MADGLDSVYGSSNPSPLDSVYGPPKASPLDSVYVIQPPASQATGIGPRPMGGAAAGTPWASTAELGERLINVVRNSAIGRAFHVETAVSPQAQRPTIVQAMTAYQANPQLKAQIDAHAAKNNIEPTEVLRQIVNTPIPESNALLNFSELVPNRPGKGFAVARGTAQFASGLTEPENLLLLAGSGGLSSIARTTVGRLITAGFSASMIVNAARESKEFYDALQRGDSDTATEHLTKGVLSGTFGVLAARGAIKGGTGAGAIPEEILRKAGQPIAEPIAAEPLAEDAAASRTQAQLAGLPKDVADRITQNAQAMKPIADPEKIETRGDVGKQLDQAADVLTRNPDPRMQQPLTFEEQKKLADNLGMKVEDLLSTQSGQSFKPEEVVAANSLLKGSQTQVMNLARQAATGDAEYQGQFLTALARHQEIMDVVRGRVAAEAGRALGAFRVEAPERSISDAVNALSKLPKDAQLTAAQQLAKIDPNDSGAISRFTREITPASTADKIYEGWMNGLLTGSISVVKAASDLTMRGLGVLVRPTAAMIDSARSLFTGAPKERFAGEAGADLYGMYRGWSRAAGQFADTFFHESGIGEQALDSGARQQTIKGTLGKVIRTPSRLLEAITDSAKLLNYSAEIHAQAYRQAAKEGLSGAGRWSRAEELASNPTDQMRQAAANYGLEQTFQQKLGPAGQKVTELRNAVPGGRYLLPFIKTPLNILKAGVEYSPVGAAKSGIKALAGRDVSTDTLAKNAVGTAMTGALLYNALQGNITGGGPTNPKDRLRLEAQGWQPYSVKVGNKFVSFRRLEPIGTVLGATADLAEIIKNNGFGSEGVTSSIRQKINNNIENAPFLGGLMRLNQIWENPGKYARGLVGSAIPTGVADTAKAIDPTVRNPKTVLEQLQSRIPGMTRNVPAVTTPEGRPLQRPASALGGFNPYPVSTGEPQLSALEEMLARKETLRNVKEARKQLIKQRVAARRAAQQ